MSTVADAGAHRTRGTVVTAESNDDRQSHLTRAAAELRKDRGPEPYRNRYRIEGPRSFLLRARFVYLQSYRRALIRAGRWIAEQLLFGSPGGVFRPAFRRAVSSMIRNDVTDVSLAFDADLYVAQFRSVVRRKRAEVDPVLHYCLIGWREVRTPHVSFDPVFYLHQNPQIGRKTDPYLHYMRNGRMSGSAATSHEVLQQKSLDPPVLIFNHGRGGGAVRFLQEREKQAKTDVRLRPIAGKPRLVVWESSAGDTAFDLSRSHDWQLLEDKARQARISRLLINHVIDQDPDVLPHIYGLASKLGVPYDIVLHDYYFLCPRVDGITGEGRFCGIAPTSTCAKCVATDYSELGHVDPTVWRSLTLQFLQGAESVTIHSNEFAERVERYLPSVNIVVKPLEADSGYPPEICPNFGAGQAFRIATVGALNIPKGAAVVLDLSVAMKRYQSLDLTIIGPTIFDKLLERQGVKVTGRYREDQLQDLIRSHAPHAIFLPAIWPETWSFVLTEALKTGLPIIAFDIGAPAERLRRLKRGHLLPLDLAYRSNDLAKAFDDLRQKWTRQI